MPHDHGHAHFDPDSGDRRVAIAIWANGLLTVALMYERRVCHALQVFHIPGKGIMRQRPKWMIRPTGAVGIGGGLYVAHIA